jgi:hypothetical protein
MFRPFYEKQSTPDMHLDADTVARSFGAVIPITPRTAGNNGGRVSVTTAPSGIVPSSEKRTALTLVAQLIALKPDTKELADRKQWLIDELTPLLAEVDAFTTTVEEKRRKSLKDALVKIRAQCRKAQKFYDLQVENLKTAELNLQNAAAAQEGALKFLQELKAVEQSGQHVPRWATEKEIAVWDVRVEEAKERVRQMNKEAAAAFSERNQMNLKIDPARRELEKLANEEIRWRHELDGREFYDTEFGLSNRTAGHITA